MLDFGDLLEELCLCDEKDNLDRKRALYQRKCGDLTRVNKISLDCANNRQGRSEWIEHTDHRHDALVLGREAEYTSSEKQLYLPTHQAIILMSVPICCRSSLA